MVFIKHKNGVIRMSSDGVIRAQVGRRLLPGTFPSVTLARVAIAHSGYRSRQLGS